MADSYDIVVIGGGITGLASAYWLAREGLDVAVIEKGVVGWEASGRNGGMIGERAGEPPVTPMGMESVRLWPAMDEELGYPTEFVKGTLHISLEDAPAGLAREREIELGIPSEHIDAETLREMCPPVSPDARYGIYHPNAGHANPQRSTHAFAWALQDRGGHILQHTTVTGITVQGERVVSVETSAGTIATDFVICAAGPQTGHIAGMAGVHVPVAPGMLEIIVTAPVEPLSPSGVSGNGLYGRQTLRGNLVHGGGALAWADATLETPRKPNSPVIRSIARRLYELLPGLGDVPVLRSWAGMVEVTPDNLPIVDRLEHLTNMVVATFSSHGFGLAPAAGKAIRDLVVDRESPLIGDGLGLNRFSGMSEGWRERYRWTPDGEPATA